MKKVLVITGATAVGKSDLSIRVAKQYKAEIINADSQQVYKELMIGTAKVDEQTQLEVPHHGLDLIAYTQNYNVMEYQTMAREAIKNIHNKNKLPILVGGSGLYLKACLYDYHFEVEDKQDASFDHLSNIELFEQLKHLDEHASLSIHPNNRKRVMRAINIALSGKSKTQREAEQKKELIYDVLMIVVDRDREVLHQRIEQRVEAMFNQGLKEELIEYFKEPKTWSYQSFQAIGYKEWKPYFEHGIGEEEVKQAIIVATRQYAKRQYTWFRHQFDAQWFNPDQQSEASLFEMISAWLNKEEQ